MSQLHPALTPQEARRVSVLRSWLLDHSRRSVVMFDLPQTVEEARRHRYNVWSGNSKGSPWQEKFCAYEVWDNHLSRQCRSRPGKGPGGLYCTGHAKRVSAKEEEAEQAA